MLFWAIAATIIALGLLVALIQYRKQIRKNCQQLQVMQKHSSNQRLTSEVPYREINELVMRINDICNQYREESIAVERNENNLKEAIANLSHDIRTPLTSLDGYVQLLVMSDSPEDREHYLQIIQNRIASLKELLEELFTYTKMQDQHYELACMPMDARQCICETVLSFYENFTDRGLQPEVEFCEETLPINGNEVALRRVVQNLIKNALEHGTDRLGLKLENQDGKLHFVCYNDKKGDEVVDIEKIFDRFYKGDRARTSTSTGLGLSIAKGLIDRMNGEISASVDKGLFIINVTIPLSKEMTKNNQKDH